MKRYLESCIRKDLDKKIILLNGPRQVGKTTLSKSIYPETTQYFNIDNSEDRLLLKDKSWSRDSDLVIFDELHKMNKWKSWIKGVYDTEGVRPRLLVTGSARMDVYRKGSDSLAGRFFSHRLHPLSVSEVKGQLSADDALDNIIRLGGFPEPFLSQSETSAKRWRRSHVDRIIREDLVDLSAIRNIKGVETLVELLRNYVSRPVSYQSLARDLEVSFHTVKSWIEVLESMYIIFTVTPYSHNIVRGLLKQPKIYFYDTGFIKDDEAARLENAVACALLKRLHFLEDTMGEKNRLHYVRDKDKCEVDFVTLRDGKLEYAIEVKQSGRDVSQMQYFKKFFPKNVLCFLLAKESGRDLDVDGIKVRRAAQWLQNLEA